MLDIKLLRSNPEDLRDRLAIKGYALDVNEFLSLDNERRLARRLSLSKDKNSFTSNAYPFIASLSRKSSGFDLSNLISNI